ncbi:MAG: hypothetical protein ABJF60_03035 [Roseobacter sp.]
MNQRQSLPGCMLYNSQQLSARFVDADSDIVVVSFPDRVHPTDLLGKGWGEDFFNYRELSAVYINIAATNWFQISDFFDAMATIRAAIGSGSRVVTYGSSMGGYAALLAAKALNADRCLALAPQFDISQTVVPFETRFQEHAHRIGPFMHILKAQASQRCAYFVAYDPTHRIDAKHVVLLERHFNLKRVLCHGAGHGVLSHWIETKALAELSCFLTGELDVSDFRKAIRARRINSPKYLRRMANKAAKAQHIGLIDYSGLAREQGFLKVADKIRAAAPKPRKLNRRLVIHAGLAKKGTSSLKTHLFPHVEK